MDKVIKKKVAIKSGKKRGRKKAWCDTCKEVLLDNKNKCSKCGNNNYELGHEIYRGDLIDD